jgi:arylsulfatase A-like enzyme
MNLICICLDTFRYDLIKTKAVDTPNLDAFAAKGVVFDQAFGEAQPTLQMRRAFFTGKRSFPWRFNFDRRGHWHHAAGWHKIPPEQDTLAEILLRKGYFTGLIADTYHMFKPTMNYTRGFVTYDFVRGQESDNWRGGHPHMVEAQMRRHVRPPIDWIQNSTLMQYLLNVRERRREEDYFCAKVFQSGMQWLEESLRNQPFFLWIDSFDPHEPWDPPREYADRYYPDYEGIDFIMGRPPADATPEEKERVKALYYGEVTLVDKWVGQFFQKIEELGLTDNTLILVTSDHGTQLMDHNRFGKRPDAMHPYNTQILWLMQHPDGPQGKSVQGFVQSHDVMPTMLHLLGIPCGQVDGENVWPLVTGELSQIRDHIVIGWAGWTVGNAVGGASVRDTECNFITTIGMQNPVTELYHLARDPEENHNVISQYPRVEERQRERLEAVLMQPLPGIMPELCDVALSPIRSYNQHRYGIKKEKTVLLHDVP